MLYAIQCSTTGQYVQASGALGGSPAFRTLAQWGAPVTVTGLASSTSYSFKVAAGNPGDTTPTTGESSASVYGATAGGTTSGSSDLDAPCAASAFQIAARTAGSVSISFTAPFEDCLGSAGNPSAYIVKYSDEALTDVNWADGFVFSSNYTASAAAGATETIEVTGLESNQVYYFQVKAIDDVSNVGPLASLSAPGSDVGRTFLHVGWNIGGVEGLLGATTACQDVFGVAGCYTWSSSGLGDWSGSYVNTGAAGAVSSGTGYWLTKSSEGDLVPPVDATPTTGSLSIALQPGMNLVSSPHDAPVSLADCTITFNGSDTRSFAEAASTAGWVAPAVYAYDGSNYFTETYNTLPPGQLHPRKGYWLKLLKNDGSYTLNVPDPTP